MNRFDTVILSDLHLGARNARTRHLRQFLEWVRTDRLILAGDVFDDPALGNLDARGSQLIDTLQAFSRRNELVWLKGNHDPIEARRFGWHAVCREELVIDIGGRAYGVCHGHRWDKSLELPAWIIRGADAIYHFAQRLDPSHRLARRLKRHCKRFCRSIRMLQEQAVFAARQRHLHGMILGHSHVAHDSCLDGVHYLNTGCWTEAPSGFVGIRGGQARTYYWHSATEAPEPLPTESDERLWLAAVQPDCPCIPEAA